MLCKVFNMEALTKSSYYPFNNKYSIGIIAITSPTFHTRGMELDEHRTTNRTTPHTPQSGNNITIL